MSSLTTHPSTLLLVLLHVGRKGAAYTSTEARLAGGIKLMNIWQVFKECLMHSKYGNMFCMIMILLVIIIEEEFSFR